MKSYDVFPQFWKAALTFGIKEVENEFEFPAFRTRRTRLDDAGIEDVHGKFRSKLNGI